MITQETLDTAGEIIGNALREKFKEGLVFDPIVIERAVDEWGDDYLRVTVVFEGDQKLLDPGDTITLVREVREKLLEEGINEFPVTGYIRKLEWDRWQRQDRLRAERRKLGGRRKYRATR